MKLNILIVGVGGQGILFLSKVLAKVANDAGYEVIGSETHGMAQRGGSVSVHLKIGDFQGPLIPMGGADYLIALDSNEALRALPYLKTNGVLVVNRNTDDMSLWQKAEVSELLKNKAPKLHELDATAIAMHGNYPKAINVIMLGAMSKFTEIFTTEAIEKGVRDNTPKKFLELNLEAFAAGKKDS